IYVKRFRPDSSQQRINYVGRIVTVCGALIAIVLTVAIDSIKGLNLFNVFQSVLGFIAPPMTAVFLLGVFWKRTTTRAANLALTAGTVFCLIVGILYLWPPSWLHIEWPHFMMLSFLLFVVLALMMAVVSWTDKTKPVTSATITKERSTVPPLVAALWLALAAVMVGLYVFFN
ncbi:MAG: Na+/glucose cotransporter, partial [Prevotella sp.]|nr:Na+/glucose cotransporter [Prevotella sp.]